MLQSCCVLAIFNLQQILQAILDVINTREQKNVEKSLAKWAILP